MKTKTLIFTLTAITAFTGFAAFTVAQPGKGRVVEQRRGDISTRLVETAALSNQEKTMLLDLQEEEKMAGDLYTAFSEKWGRSSFSMIAGSEQNHIDEVNAVLDFYNLEGSTGEKGVFKNREIQKLYDDFLEKGSESLTVALKVAAQVEDLDLSDLIKYKAQTSNENLLLVLGNLERGSENHLRAYTRQLAMNGEEYQPQHLTAAEYESIIAGSNMRGRGYGMAQADSSAHMMPGMRNNANDTSLYGRRMMQGMPPMGQMPRMGRMPGMQGMQGMHGMNGMRGMPGMQGMHRMPQRPAMRGFGQGQGNGFRRQGMESDSAFHRGEPFRNDTTYNRGEGQGRGYRNNGNMPRQFRNNNNQNNSTPLYRNQSACLLQESKKNNLL